MLFYNTDVNTRDVIIIGGGIVGLSLARELRRRGANVLLLERGACGREASHAAGGMIADCPLEMPPALHPLAAASARMYPPFVNQLQIENPEKMSTCAVTARFFSLRPLT